MEVPPGYELFVEGDVTIAARHADMTFVRACINESGTVSRYAEGASGSHPLQGRGVAYVMHAGDARWVVRHYRRGGAIASALGDRYLRAATPRPVAELIVSEAARARGIATPAVAAAVVYNDGMWYRGDIATQFIPDAADLAEISLSARKWTDEMRSAAWRAAGAALRMAFEGGLEHPDLNLKNILVQKTETGVKAFVIDLDRAHLRPSAVSPGERTAMLSRLERSRLKIEKATGFVTTPIERQAFAEGLGS
jgi:3-deoxy-D-manno-octulosonic acid kinase